MDAPKLLKLGMKRLSNGPLVGAITIGPKVSLEGQSKFHLVPYVSLTWSAQSCADLQEGRTSAACSQSYVAAGSLSPRRMRTEPRASRRRGPPVSRSAALPFHALTTGIRGQPSCHRLPCR